MLRECVRLCSWGRFEGHGAEGAFKEDLTVSALDVRLDSCNISEDHTAVDTATEKKDLSRLEYTFFLIPIFVCFHCILWISAPIVVKIHT